MTRKTTLFEGRSWVKFNNLGLALGKTLKFYTSVAKWLKLKVRKIWGLSPTFVEVKWEKLAGGFFAQISDIEGHRAAATTKTGLSVSTLSGTFLGVRKSQRSLL